VLALAGPTITAFHWRSQACAPDDVPDLPTRALRDEANQAQLTVAHIVNRRLIGPDFDHLEHRCAPVLTSPRDGDPSHFTDREWLASLYSSDGRNVAALLHEEYQGNQHPGRCPSGLYMRCWYNSITFAVSRDGGATYQLPSGRLVASSSRRYVPDAGPSGVFAPSNLVRNPHDGYFYALAQVIEPSAGVRGTCVMRTRYPFEPGSWRWWDGIAFRGRFHNPYAKHRFRSTSACRPVAHIQIQEMHETVTFNVALKRFLLIDRALDDVTRTTDLNFSTSTDLIHWTMRRPIEGTSRFVTPGCRDLDVTYPSVIDPASPSRTFDTSGRAFDLYLTRFQRTDCSRALGPARDLVRVRVHIVS
jgi:hypothetical protein